MNDTDSSVADVNHGVSRNLTTCPYSSYAVSSGLCTSSFRASNVARCCVTVLGQETLESALGSSVDNT